MDEWAKKLRKLRELPVLSWEESAKQYSGQGYPIGGVYDLEHTHRLSCGHLMLCPWFGQGEPCQAYEHVGSDDKCWDCYES